MFTSQVHSIQDFSFNMFRSRSNSIEINLYSFIGTASNPYNSLSLYSADERRRDKTRVIVRSTSKPREVLVDTSGIFSLAGEISEPTTPTAIGNGSTKFSRTPFRPPDLL
jgi:hypothetical protein